MVKGCRTHNSVPTHWFTQENLSILSYSFIMLVIMFYFVFFISLPVILVRVHLASSLILCLNKVPTLKNVKGVQLQTKQKYNKTAFYV